MPRSLALREPQHSYYCFGPQVRARVDDRGDVRDVSGADVLRRACWGATLHWIAVYSGGVLLFLHGAYFCTSLTWVR